MSSKSTPPKYTDVLCIGAGLSGIALGARLQTHYPHASIHFYDRHSDLGGTWHVNTYPGAACDVPSVLYSLSFAMNASWSRMTPSHEEIKAYSLDVARRYGIPERTSLGTEVVGCVWDDGRGVWRVRVRRVKGEGVGRECEHECRVLFSASGGLVYPNTPKIEGMEKFEGKMFHSAEWDHSVELKGKNVVIVGNGCTAAQIVPAIAEEAASVTQIVRSAHWMVEAPKTIYTPTIRWIFRNIPLANRLHRFVIFLLIEETFRLFGGSERSKRYRAALKPKLERYMRRVSPEKYHDILIPTFEVGYAGYLRSLHSPHITLTKSLTTSITPNGIQTSGGHHKADVIVFATGFKTNYFPLPIVGKQGITLQKHFENLGGAGAYRTTAVNGFPNFFMILGPNSATGHTSALMAAENAIEYAMKVLKPVFRGKAGTVEVKAGPERDWTMSVQRQLKGMVWDSGCGNWYSSDTGWNAMTYPWSQVHFWWNSLFVDWEDWEISYTKPNKPKSLLSSILMLAFLAFVCTCTLMFGQSSKLLGRIAQTT